MPKLNTKTKSAKKPTKTLAAQKKLTTKAPKKSSTKKKLDTLNFSLPWSGSDKIKKNFATNFEYGDFSIKIYSTVKGKIVTFNVKIHSKNFSFDGVATLNAKSFSDLQTVFNHIKSNIKNVG